MNDAFKIKTVYFAGKVRYGGGYREQLFKTGRVMSSGYTQYFLEKQGYCIYGGPFALSCDHGGFHGEGTHGFSAQPLCGCYLGDAKDLQAPDDCINLSDHNNPVNPHFVVDRCMKQIQYADAVHAYIDSTDCYGTLVEIGYASACRKPIYLVFSFEMDFMFPGQRLISPQVDGPEDCPNTDELWFVKFLPYVKDCRMAEPTFIHPDLVKLPYAEYLKTDHWQAKRLEVLQRAEHRCQLCNSGDVLHVHHRTYDNLWNENPNDLTVLCGQCHSKFHGKL